MSSSTSGPNPTTTKKSSWAKHRKTITKVFVSLLVIFPLLWAYNRYAAPMIWPALQAGIRMDDRNADKFVKTRAGEIEKHTFKKPEQYQYTDAEHKGEIDPDAWFRIAMGAANNVRDDREKAEAVKARSRGIDAAITRTEVLGDQFGWVTMRRLHIPARITVERSDTITPHFRPQDQTNADGRPFDPGRHPTDQTVLMYEHSQSGLPMQDVGNVDELIGRFCSGPNNCRLGFPLGTDSVICVGPGFYDGGDFQAWHNGLLVQDGTRMLLDFSNGGGKYRLTITPDDPATGRLESTRICSEHPRALVVKKPQPATETVTASS